MSKTTRRILLAALVAAPFTLAAPALRAENAAPADLGLLFLPNASASPRPGAGKTIARLWRGRTLAAKADAYEKYLFASGIPLVRSTRGNLGVTVMRREDGKETEFLVLSIWESLDAVKRFAGKDYEKAVILPRDLEYLISVEPNVRHYALEREERPKK
jgi:heme-degrading monooxygenase HmoA